jgi:hypothetical protein
LIAKLAKQLGITLPRNAQLDPSVFMAKDFMSSTKLKLLKLMFWTLNKSNDIDFNIGDLGNFKGSSY